MKNLKNRQTNKTTFDFGSGPVPAHKHCNGGGWVADTTSVDKESYVGPGAMVYDTAIMARSPQGSLPSG